MAGLIMCSVFTSHSGKSTLILSLMCVGCVYFKHGYDTKVHSLFSDHHLILTATTRTTMASIL